MITSIFSLFLLCSLITPEHEAATLIEEIQGLTFYSKIQTINNALEKLKPIIEKVTAHSEKNKISSAIDKIVTLATYISERENIVEENLIAIAALPIHKKKDASATIKQEDLDAIEHNYTRYLDLFYQELKVLIELLIPLLDCENMTEEEINKILTV